MNHVGNRISSMINVCTNFDTIVDYPIVIGDNLTAMLVDYYRDFLSIINLTNIEEVSLMYHYDQALFFYLEDHNFYKYVQQYYEMENTENNFIPQNMIELYSVFQNKFVKKKDTSWI